MLINLDYFLLYQQYHKAKQLVYLQILDNAQLRAFETKQVSQTTSKVGSMEQPVDHFTNFFDQLHDLFSNVPIAHSKLDSLVDPYPNATKVHFIKSFEYVYPQSFIVITVWFRDSSYYAGQFCLRNGNPPKERNLFTLLTELNRCYMFALSGHCLLSFYYVCLLFYGYETNECTTKFINLAFCQPFRVGFFITHHFRL